MNPLRPKFLRAAGFTLMEMMLVLLIIAVIIGTGAYMMTNMSQSADLKKARFDINTIETALIRYKIDNMTLPTQSQGLEALVTKPSGDPPARNWMQYVKPELLNDPWGHRYQYRNPGKHNPTGYDIFTTGPDGSEIGNW